MFRNHRSFYEFVRTILCIFILIISVTCFIMMFFAGKIWWVFLLSMLVSDALFAAGVWFMGKLIEDIDDLDHQIVKMINESRIVKKQINQNSNSLNETTKEVKTKEINKAEDFPKENIEETQTIETSSQQSVEEEPKTNTEIKLDGKVKIMVGENKDKIGIVDNILSSSTGIVYVILFKDDKKEYRFKKDEIIPIE